MEPEAGRDSRPPVRGGVDPEPSKIRPPTALPRIPEQLPNPGSGKVRMLIRGPGPGARRILFMVFLTFSYSGLGFGSQLARLFLESQEFTLAKIRQALHVYDGEKAN